MPNVLGLEIGGTKLQLGLGAGDGTISRLIRRDIQPDHGAEGIRAQILDLWHSLDANIHAIGVGFGGPLDSERGVVTTSNQIGGWSGFPLGDWLREMTDVRSVAVQNDADTAALGEARFGAGRGLSPILYVNSGSGIGGGLIVNGRIYRGSGAGAMEIGHLVASEEMHATEPRHLTLEDVASGWAIGQRGRDWARRMTSPAWQKQNGFEAVSESPGSLLSLAEGDPDRVDAKMVAKSARMGHSDGKVVLGRAYAAMGAALAHAITLLAPRRVILGGGVSLMGDDLWLNPIREQAEKRVYPPLLGTFDMVTAQLGEDVVIQGALALAADALS